MKLKYFALCAVAAVTGCTTESNNNDNTLGTIALTGTLISGEVLNTTVNDADGISGNINYFWYADGEAIAGANNASFTLTDEQIGSKITAQALYTDDNGINESHITDPTADVSAISYPASVTVAGDALIGSTLTATVNDQNDFDSDTVVYTWFADNVEIAGQVLSTLMLAEAQFGAVISVNTTFVDNNGFAESATSTGTVAVSRTNSEGMVSISGTPTVGNTLTSTVSDTDAISGTISYQWYADDVELTGETQSTYVVAAAVGEVITVQVTYTDDNGFDEDNVSAATIPVSAVAVNDPGSIAITGSSPYLVSGELTAEITDNNGVNETTVVYKWLADGVEILGATSKTFTPTAYAGSIISVNADYDDNDNFTESVDDALDTLVYTTVVSNSIDLLGAVSSFADGDVVGLNTNTYTDMDPILLTSAVTLRAVEGQKPVITGEACIHVADAVDGAAVTGLTFKNIDTKAGSFCETEEVAVIYSEGDNFTFNQNSIEGEETTLNNSDYTWMVIKGQGAMIERNTFSGRNTAEKGSIIRMSSSSSDHTIQYNLFHDSSTNPNHDQSSLYLLNVGSTTGTDSADDTNFTIQYNLVKDFVTGRRLMRVQTSGATIKGNTIVNPNGGISLEDGGFNSVTDNIIIRTTDIPDSNDRPSGVLITPLGHTVSNNYIAGIRSENKEAGGIVFTANPFSQATGGIPNSGNQAVLDAGGDFELKVTNNTVLNSVQPIVFSDEIGSKAAVDDCDDLTSGTLFDLTRNAFDIQFEGNLIANGLGDAVGTNSSTQGLFLPFDASGSDHSFEYDCDLINRDEFTFKDNFGFSDSFASGTAYKNDTAYAVNPNNEDYWKALRDQNGNGKFDSDGAIDQDPATNGKEAPELVTAASTLIESDPAGNQSLAGAKGLHYIQDAEVGVGSTWVAN
jgi:parallel beta-helix repeat protein